jgi:hypothetical protein
MGQYFSFIRSFISFQLEIVGSRVQCSYASTLSYQARACPFNFITI